MIESGKYKGYKFFLDENMLYATKEEDKIKIFKNIDFVTIISNNHENKNNYVDCKFSLNKEECYAIISFEIYMWLIINGLK